ncbi:uncharacterized protein LOC144014729 isoform X1 [Festucalex cinctus]
MKAVTYRPNMYTHTLSVKSDDEIYALLNDMGIKHGPVVDSTRSLYEKKIVEAMAKWKKALRTRPDKTYYREEEKVTYFYRTPIRSDLPENKRSTSDSASPYRSSRLSARPKKSSQDVPKKARSSSFIPVWAQLVFFLIAAVFLYLVISNISNICWSISTTVDHTKKIE